jgi:hypothetical protein
MPAGFVLSEHGICRLIHRSPELFFWNFRRIHPSNEESFQFFFRAVKARNGPTAVSAANWNYTFATLQPASY